MYHILRGASQLMNRFEAGIQVARCEFSLDMNYENMPLTSMVKAEKESPPSL